MPYTGEIIGPVEACFQPFAENYWCCEKDASDDYINIALCVYDGYIPCSEGTFCDDGNIEQLCEPLFDISDL